MRLTLTVSFYRALAALAIVVPAVYMVASAYVRIV
jgi:hypothetical protein